jgi:amidophosphoribosyltransferase
MCGMAGIVGKSAVNQQLYDALTVLQHRGQDAAGIVTCDDGTFKQRKANGLVRDVFRTEHMERLTGSIGIGHCRYPTAGSSSSALAQPFYVSSPYGICLAHNGNLTNSDQLEQSLRAELRHLNTDSDSEVLLNLLANELQLRRRPVPDAEDFFAAVRGVQRQARGGYAAIALIAGCGMLAFRDPNGIRPLVFGERESPAGTEYMIASESVALDVLGFRLTRDVAPGEAVFIDEQGRLTTRQCADNPRLRPCIFEHVYFARPDSIMDGVSVYKARLRQGERLAEKIKRLRPDHDIDVVIPIPDTSRTAAQVIAYELDVKFREGLMKNRYIGRTFIMPGQAARKKSVRQKLNAIELEFRDKNVLLVDDSIVRGTTCREIIQMARDAGANRVYFASAAPPVRYPNVYGIDMPTAEELIAYGHSDEEVGRLIGADWLVYQDLEDLVSCSRDGNPEIEAFDCSVFDGKYVTGDVDAAYLERLHDVRNDASKEKREAALRSGDSGLVGLHNHNPEA